MMQFPVGNTLFVVLEPGNIRKMREGQPLVLRPLPGTTSIGIVSTPDIIELRRRIQLPTSPEMLSAAIESCKDLPEIDRGAEPVTTAVTAAENTENQIALLAGSAETGGEKAGPKYEGMLPDLRPRYGWMDSVDFDRELGNALGGNVVYPTKENLYENRKCLDTDGECTGIRVVIFSLETPHLYWQGNAETHLGCGHSKWDSRRDCLACLQSAVDSMNHQLATFRSSSQNQTVSSGVEGAHEGTTADKSGSREPEKLNNAQQSGDDLPEDTHPLAARLRKMADNVPPDFNTNDDLRDGYYAGIFDAAAELDIALAESSLSHCPHFIDGRKKSEVIGYFANPVG